MVGPFISNIMPVKATYRYDDLAGKWKVIASRYIAVGTNGRRYERLRESFDDYAVALTAVSVFFGNS